MSKASFIHAYALITHIKIVIQSIKVPIGHFLSCFHLSATFTALKIRSNMRKQASPSALKNISRLTDNSIHIWSVSNMFLGGWSLPTIDENKNEAPKPEM